MQMPSHSYFGHLMELGGGASIARGDLHFTFSRSSGPGGQAVNKVNTRAELRLALASIRGMDDAARDRLRRLAGRRLTQDDEIVLHAETYRSQQDNREAALERLRGLVAQAMVRPKRRRKTKPSRGAVERRLSSKRIQSEKKRKRKSGDD